MDWECFLHSKSVTQEALVLLLTQTIGLERLLREFWSRGPACWYSSTRVQVGFVHSQSKR